MEAEKIAKLGTKKIRAVDGLTVLIQVEQISLNSIAPPSRLPIWIFSIGPHFCPVWIDAFCPTFPNRFTSIVKKSTFFDVFYPTCIHRP